MLLAHAAECVEDVIQFLVRVRRHVGRTHQRLTLRHGGRDHSVDKYPFLEQVIPESEAGHHVTDDNWNDRGLAGPYVESRIAKSLTHVVADLPESLETFGL